MPEPTTGGGVVPALPDAIEQALTRALVTERMVMWSSAPGCPTATVRASGDEKAAAWDALRFVIAAHVHELATALRETDNLVVYHHASGMIGATCEDGATCLVCHQQGAIQTFGRNARLLRHHRALAAAAWGGEVGHG